MAEWDIIWVPQQIYKYKAEHKTTISKFENGAEQRRKKWSRPKYHFELIFNALSYAVVDAIRLFFNETTYGSYTTFYFMNFAQSIKGVTLAITDGGADTFTDSGSGFEKKGFSSDLYVYVNGSDDALNNKIYPLITTVVAGTITMPAAQVNSADSADADLEFFVAYKVRFKEDTFENRFLAPTVSNTRVIELIEVI